MQVSKKSIVFAIAGLAAAAGAGYWAARSLWVESVAHAQIEVSPYTLEQEIRTFSGDGSFSVKKRRILARRAEGSTVMSGTMGSAHMRRITFADGRIVSVYDFLKSKVTERLSSEELARFKAQQQIFHGDCERADSAAPVRSEQVSGAETKVFLKPMTDLRIYTWRSPTYGCVSMRSVVEKKDEAGKFAKASETELIRFIPGKPDPALFAIGDGYVELAPRELLRRAAAALGVTAGDCPGCLNAADLGAQDQEYASRQNPK